MGQECIPALIQNMIQPTNSAEIGDNLLKALQSGIKQQLNTVMQNNCLKNQQCKLNINQITLTPIKINSKDNKLSNLIQIVDMERSGQFRQQQRIFWE